MEYYSFSSSVIKQWIVTVSDHQLKCVNSFKSLIDYTEDSTCVYVCVCVCVCVWVKINDNVAIDQNSF